MSDEVEIGRGKRGRRAYTLDDIALVPSRRTRDPEDVNVGWQIDAYHVDTPLMAAPMDSVMSPETAIAFGRLGGIGVLDLDGLWTRYEDPTPILDHIAHLGEEESIATLQRVYSEPIKPSLITARLKQLREAGVVVAGKLSPQRVQKYWRAVVDAGVDLFIIRGSTVSAEHVSSRREPLNLKRFIYELDVPVIVGGVCTDTAALHLMRTGAAGVLVGFGGGAAHSTRRSLGVHAPMVRRPLRARHRGRRHRPQRRPVARDRVRRGCRHARRRHRPRGGGSGARLALGIRGDPPGYAAWPACPRGHDGHA